MIGMAEALNTSLPIPAVLIDPDDRIVEINGAAELFFNASDRSLAGSYLLDRMQADGSLLEAFGRVRRDNAPLFVNLVEVSVPYRSRATCDLQIAPVTDEEGFVLITIAPRQIAGRLQKAGNARSSARQAIGMAEMLAHEIKNPLAGITGAAQLLSMSLNEEDSALTDLIVAESKRIVALLDQVEHFGNLRPPERKPVNLHDVLDRAQRTAALGFAAQMRFEQAYDPSLPETWADADQLQQVILNLIRNAAQAAGAAGGRITARTFYDQGLKVRGPDGKTSPLPLQIEIIDDGPGLPEDLKDQIFDPFVSGRENGTGLGLSLVSKIVSEHDGIISVLSRQGQTVFRISLPRAPQDASSEKE